MLPNLLIIGAMKAGTTSLYHYLAQHPEVYGCTPKEPMFFSTEVEWARGKDWYESLFSKSKGEKVRFEASTTYTQSKHAEVVAERIKKTIPDTKLVYVVRCPVERMRSHHEHMVSRGTAMNLTEALNHSDRYLRTSSYFSRLRPYLRLFEKEQIHVISFEEFRDTPRPILKALCEFVGVDPRKVASFASLGKMNNSQVNLAATARAQGEELLRFTERGPGVTPEKRKMIVDRLKREQSSLEEALGRRFSHWDIEASFDALFQKGERARG